MRICCEEKGKMFDDVQVLLGQSSETVTTHQLQELLGLTPLSYELWLKHGFSAKNI